MSAFEDQAYRYSFTTDWDISAPGLLTLSIKKPGGAVVVWTPVIDGAYACHCDVATDENSAGLYAGQPVWKPTGALDDPQYGPEFAFEVLARLK